MNVLRGDVARLQRCTAIKTGSSSAAEGSSDSESIPRSKPFKYAYEKEIVMYAYFKKLDYFSTECIYSPNAYRGHARTFIKDLEKIRYASHRSFEFRICDLVMICYLFSRPSSIMDIIHSGESMAKCVSDSAKERMPAQGVCRRCGYISSMDVCKVKERKSIASNGPPNIRIPPNIAGLCAPRGSQQRAPPVGCREECQEHRRLQSLAAAKQCPSSKQRGTASKGDHRFLDCIDSLFGAYADNQM